MAEGHKERQMKKVSTDQQIDRFTEAYPLLERPVDILRRVADFSSIPLRIHICVKHFDQLTPYITGCPTSPQTIMTGEGSVRSFEGTQEWRLYGSIPSWLGNPLQLLHEWVYGDHERLGNVLVGIKPGDLAYLAVEVCDRWFESRLDYQLQRIVGRTALRAIDSRFIILLPPKGESISDVLERARVSIIEEMKLPRAREAIERLF